MTAALLQGLSRALWGWPAVSALMLSGAYVTVRTGFVQLRLFLPAMRGSIRRLADPGDGSGTSPLEAVCTALAGTIGTGNIAGVTAALTLGGPGAIFWMWVSAALGMGLKYAEIYLAVKYRERAGDSGEYVGGPMYYIKNGLGPGFRWLAVIFCLSGTAAAFGTGNLMQTASVLTATSGLLPPGVTVTLMALAVLICSRRGAGSRGRASAMIVPVMAAAYIVFAGAVVAVNIERLPAALAAIFRGALGGRSAAAGAAGSAISWGLRRGLFSNEAGIGSSPIAHASAAVSEPGEQALMGIFEVFVDTVLICTLTALAVLCSGVPIRYGVPGGAEYVAQALATVIGPAPAELFMAASMAMFAFSSIIGWSLYGQRCVMFLAGERAARLFDIAFALTTLLGAWVSFGTVIAAADILTALMMAPNLIAVVILSNKLDKNLLMECTTV